MVYPRGRGRVVPYNRRGAVVRTGAYGPAIYYGARLAGRATRYAWRNRHQAVSWWRSSPRGGAVTGRGTRRANKRVPWFSSKRRKGVNGKRVGGSRGYAKDSGNQSGVVCLPGYTFPFRRKMIRTLVAYFPPTIMGTQAVPAPDFSLVAKLFLRRPQNAQLAIHGTASAESSSHFMTIGDARVQFEVPRYLDILTAIYKKFIALKVSYDITFKLYSVSNDLVLFWKVVYPHQEDHGTVLSNVTYDQAGYDLLQRTSGVRCVEVRSNLGDGYHIGKIRAHMTSKVYRRSEVTGHSTLSDANHLTWYSHTDDTLPAVQQFSAAVVAQPSTAGEPKIYIWAYKRDSTTGTLSAAVWNGTDNDKVMIEAKQTTKCLFFHTNPSVLPQDEHEPES